MRTTTTRRWNSRVQLQAGLPDAGGSEDHLLRAARRHPLGDRRSVKTTGSGDVRGYDAGEKIKGRKLHTLVDTGGWALKLPARAAACLYAASAILLSQKLAR